MFRPVPLHSATVGDTMSAASSTVKSRVDALKIQLMEERRRRQLVMQKIHTMEQSGSSDMQAEQLPTLSAMAVHEKLLGQTAVSTSTLPSQSSRGKSAALSIPKPPPKRPQRAHGLPIARPQLDHSTPSSRKPPLPAAARKNNTVRREGGNYSLVGRRKVSEPELYVAKMRHEDRMTLVRKFALDV